MNIHQSILSDMRQHAHEIFQTALQAVDPFDAVFHHVKIKDEALLIGKNRLELKNYNRIIVVGAGKAVAPMAKAVEELLGQRVSDGAIVVKDGHGLPLERIFVHEAGHPIPDERGVRGSKNIISLVRQAKEKDMVICLISGGGSALLAAPVEGVSLKDKQKVTQLLLACGATIHEINTIRKHLSRLKGGGLARLAHPAAVTSLILSDVVGDDLDVIASGPTVPDTSTFRQAELLLKGYGIWESIPKSVRKHINKGVKGEVAETPKPGDPAFQKDSWELVGTNLQALMAASQKAERLGYRPIILSAMIEGETREIAKMHAAIAKEVIASGKPIPPPACILSGGETTVRLQGKGKGGRNQEFVLASAIALNGAENVVILSGGTDGTDGPTDAAGAIADEKTLTRAREKGLDPNAYLRQNGAYPFFQALGDLLITGPTRTNVMDIIIMLVQSKL